MQGKGDIHPHEIPLFQDTATSKGPDLGLCECPQDTSINPQLGLSSEHSQGLCPAVPTPSALPSPLLEPGEVEHSDGIEYKGISGQDGICDTTSSGPLVFC